VRILKNLKKPIAKKTHLTKFAELVEKAGFFVTEFLRAPSALPEVGIRLGVRPCVRLRQPSLCVLASVANRRLGRSIGRSSDSPRLCGCNASDGGEEDQKAAQKADRNPGNWRMRLASHNFTFSAFAWSVLQSIRRSDKSVLIRSALHNLMHFCCGDNAPRLLASRCELPRLVALADGRGVSIF